MHFIVGYRKESSPKTPLPNQKCSSCGSVKLYSVTKFVSLTALHVPVITFPRKQFIECEGCKKSISAAEYLKQGNIAPSALPPLAKFTIFHFGWLSTVVFVPVLFCIVVAIFSIFAEGQIKLAKDPHVGDLVVRKLREPFSNKSGSFPYQLQRVEHVGSDEITVRKLDLGVTDPANGKALYQDHQKDPSIILNEVENLKKEKYKNLSIVSQIRIERIEPEK